MRVRAAARVRPGSRRGLLASPARDSGRAHRVAAAPTGRAPTPSHRRRSRPPTSNASTDDDRRAGAGTDVAPTEEPAAGDALFPELGSADLDVQPYDVASPTTRRPARSTRSVTITAAIDGPRRRVRPRRRRARRRDGHRRRRRGEFEQTDGELLDHPGQPVGPAPASDPVEVTVAYHDDGACRRRPADSRPKAGSRPTAGRTSSTSPTARARGCRATTIPSDKATWRFEITVPDGVGGGRQRRTSSTSATEPARRHVGVGAARADGDVPDPAAHRRLRGGRRRRGPATRRSSSVVLRGDAERMQPYLDLIDDQIDFFERCFGPYPLDRYGIAFTDSFSGLAMETQGRVAVHPRRLPTGAPGLVQHLLLSHELAHQWFGDAVTPARLERPLAQRVLRHVRPVDVARPCRLWRPRGPKPRRTSHRASSRPSPPVSRRGGNLFGYERYDGGAVVLHALRRELGDDHVLRAAAAVGRRERRHLADDRGLHRPRRGGRRRGT